MSDEPQTTAVVASKPGTASNLPDAFTKGGGVSFWTSLDASTDEGEALVYHARQGQGIPVADNIGKEFNLTNILMHMAETSTPAGEVQQLLRLVLITDENECLTTFSDGIRESIATLFATKGYPPYAKPPRFKVSQIKTNNGFKLLTLERVFAPKPAEMPAKNTKKAP